MYLKAMREGNVCELTPLLLRGELTIILQIFQFKELRLMPMFNIYV
jgi:hypothetical protein